MPIRRILLPLIFAAIACNLPQIDAPPSATVAPTIPSISAEIEEKARQTGRNVTLSACYVEYAFDAMAAGDGEVHDRMVADAAAKIGRAHV